MGEGEGIDHEVKALFLGQSANADQSGHTAPPFGQFRNAVHYRVRKARESGQMCPEDRHMFLADLGQGGDQGRGGRVQRTHQGNSDFAGLGLPQKAVQGGML